QPTSLRNSDVGSGPGSEPLSLAAGARGQSGGGIGWEEEAKLVYGVVFSLRNICNKLKGSSEGGFLSYRTSSYKLHHHTTATSLHLVLLTDPSIESSVIQAALKQIHAQCYVEHVARNPLARREGRIVNEGFGQAVGRLVRGLAAFESPA
ncbi:TRAPP subunit bet5, partial [Gonapodya sp. JEL0774]